MKKNNGLRKKQVRYEIKYNFLCWRRFLIGAWTLLGYNWCHCFSTENNQEKARNANPRHRRKGTDCKSAPSKKQSGKGTDCKSTPSKKQSGKGTDCKSTPSEERHGLQIRAIKGILNFAFFAVNFFYFDGLITSSIIIISITGNSVILSLVQP